MPKLFKFEKARWRHQAPHTNIGDDEDCITSSLKPRDYQWLEQSPLWYNQTPMITNYNSLQALNLLGNPIQSNISDDQLRKAVCGLLPKLVYLNKQSIKTQRGREILTDSVAKAALGNSSRTSYRRALKKGGGHGGSSSSSVHRSSASVSQKIRNRSRSQTKHH